MTPPGRTAPDHDVVLHPVHHRPPVSGRSRRRLVVGLLAAVAIAGAAGGAAMLSGFLPNPIVAGDPEASGHGDLSAAPAVPTVKVSVIHPRKDPSVRLTVEALATVEPYYRADLRTRASGLVKWVHKDIGDRVRQGELLVEIEVPDAVQEVAQKEAVVGQRKQELRVARAHLHDAEAGREVARAAVREKQALVIEKEATRDFRRMRLARLRKLAASGSLVEGVLDEEERDTRASEAAVTAAEVAVERSRADLAEAESKVEAALADIDLKVALVEVARKDLDRARAVADYARVVAPFDGVVVRRTVDPGSFVQNATTGQSEVLISVARTDLVTIAARFSDAAAPFVSPGMEAEFSIESLPGASVLGHVTRFAPSIQNSDRTMRVEVDLFNGTEADYWRIAGRVLGAGLAPLASAGSIGAVATRLAGEDTLTDLRKGDADLLSVCPTPHSPGDNRVRLIPGMTGAMTLLCHRFHDGCVLPSTAVYSRSGKPYILLVENGVTKQYPVQVQLNDGRVAKVAFVTRRRDATGATRDVLNELTGQELVVSVRQIEIGEGASVQPAIADW